MKKFQLVLIAGILAFSMILAGCGNTAQADVIDEVMKHMAARDSVAAYEHVSTVAADAGFTLEGMDAFIQTYPELVEGYQSLSVNSINISSENNVATTELEGTFTYEDGSTATFTALLHKENEVWMMTSINIEK